jgi:hypothetical protein
MLFRSIAGEVLAISQPAHAWISGQLARAWGNEEFPDPEPWEEICLAAEQHDLAWNSWEIFPTLNSDTGLPHSFLDLPLQDHLALWSQAPRLAMAFGRYVALLISLHGTSLHSKGSVSRHSAEDLALIDAYLEEQAALQARLLDSLQQDPYYAAYVRPDRLRQNQRLVSLWDYMSLLLCWGVTEPRPAGEAPAASGTATVTLSPGCGTTVVSPWPFREGQLRLVVEARRIDRRFDDENAMRAYLAEAPWIRMSLLLVPS